MAQQDPNQPQSNTNYGPFTSVLTDPLSGQANPLQPQNIRPSGHMGRAGILAMFADNFLKGIQTGERQKFEQSEKQKMERERGYDALHEYIRSSDKFTPEAKQAAEDAYIKAKWGPVNDATAKIKDGPPIIHAIKAIGQAIAGPGSDPNHRDFGTTEKDKKGKDKGSASDPMHQLLAIMGDPKNKINPQQIASEAAEQINQGLSEITGGKTTVSQPPPSQQQAVTPPAPQQQQAAPQPGAQQQPFMSPTGRSAVVQPTEPPPTLGGQSIPGAVSVAPTITPVTPPGAITAETVRAHPKVQQALATISKYKLDPSQHPQLAQALSGIPQALTPLEQSKMEEQRALTAKAQSQTREFVPINYQVTGPDGKTSLIGGLLNINTGERLTADRKPIAADSPLATAPTITQAGTSSVIGAQTRGAASIASKWIVKAGPNGEALRINPATGESAPVLDAQGRPRKLDQGLTRLAATQAFINDRFQQTEDDKERENLERLQHENDSIIERSWALDDRAANAVTKEQKDAVKADRAVLDKASKELQSQIDGIRGGKPRSLKTPQRTAAPPATANPASGGFDAKSFWSNIAKLQSGGQGQQTTTAPPPNANTGQTSTGIGYKIEP